MIEVIDENLPTYIINQYSEKMFLMDKEKFLIKATQRNHWNSVESEDEKLADFLVSKYDKAYLKEFFGQKSFSTRRMYIAMMVLKKLDK